MPLGTRSPPLVTTKITHLKYVPMPTISYAALAVGAAARPPNVEGGCVYEARERRPTDRRPLAVLSTTLAVALVSVAFLQPSSSWARAGRPTGS
jgi:hypothetical protein